MFPEYRNDEDHNKYRSAATFIDSLRNAFELWESQIAKDEQLFMRVMLVNGSEFVVSNVIADSHNIILIQGWLADGTEYQVIAHQATLQFVITVAKVTVESPRRTIGFLGRLHSANEQRATPASSQQDSEPPLPPDPDAAER